jgi:hypothetical protein
MTGAVGVGNGFNGVDLASGATLNIIGGVAPGDRNVISGNAFNGVDLAFTGTSFNKVEGNYIGTTASGTTALANGSAGVKVEGGAASNIIGGLTAGTRNVISGNADGILLTDAGTSGNFVEGNYIGTSYTGEVALGNNEGVLITNAASGNFVGGASLNDSNLISGNNVGLEVSGTGTSFNTVENNLFGTDATDKVVLGLISNDVMVDSGAFFNVFENNVVVNATHGIEIDGAATTGNNFSGNDIGTDRTGLLKLANFDGVSIYTALGNLFRSNVISNNTNIGLYTNAATNALTTVFDTTFANNGGGNIFQQ